MRRVSDNNLSIIQEFVLRWHASNSEWCELENYIEPGIDVTCSSAGYAAQWQRN